MGSLPKRITSRDLGRLNEALDYLFRELGRAVELHQSSANAGREGIIHSVETTVKFLSLFAPVISSSLHAPLSVLLDSLMSLDDGKVASVLKPTNKFGRPLASALRMSLIGGAVFTVQRLLEAGVQATAAHRAVAVALNDVGIRAARGRTGTITARTIRGWCEEVRVDIGRRHEAAQTYDLLMAEPMSEVAHLSPTQMRKFFLDKLASSAKKIRAQEGA